MTGRKWAGINGRNSEFVIYIENLLQRTILCITKVCLLYLYLLIPLLNRSFFYLKVPITSTFLFSYLIIYFMQQTSVKKISIWTKSDFFYLALWSMQNAPFQHVV